MCRWVCGQMSMQEGGGDRCVGTCILVCGVRVYMCVCVCGWVWGYMGGCGSSREETGV